MGDAIICGYSLSDANFRRLLEGTPAMQAIFAHCGNASVIAYDRWRDSLPRSKRKNAPEVRCKDDPSDPDNDDIPPYYLFATRHTPYKNKRQLESLRANPSGFLKETERDKAKLRLWIKFIKEECEGAAFEEAEFQFDWTVDEDPSIYGY
ncbi:hypothetical protein MD484_g6062, partial [Candolleomyces efflorescens]